MPLVVGLMSGTSLDGVDCALIEAGPGAPQVVATGYRPYADDLRREAMLLQAAGADELHRAYRVANRLAAAYAESTSALLAKAGIAPAQVAAIGCHGQTLRHRPADGYSIQLNNPALLAELTGIPVVADFRSRDIAAGGQGAPLVPAFHAAAFSDPTEHRVILNLGGIANVTNLHPDRTVSGFDCGPANLLLDAWCERHLGTPYDADGGWAATGRVLPELLASLSAHPYFTLSPPKSCGRDEFNMQWLEPKLASHWAPQDVQATLLELTASSVLDAIDRWLGRPAAIHACGGGAHNRALMERLAARATPCRVSTTDALGLPADFVEAVAFAWLAWRTLEGKAGNLPEVTGARGPRVLGAIYPR